MSLDDGVERAAEIIDTADSLDTVQESFDVATQDKAYKAAKALWWEYQTDKPVQDDPMPETAVTVDDTTYHVHPVPHGLVHDGEAILPDTPVREHIQEHVAGWNSSGHDIYTEQGVETVFQITDKAQSIDDRDWLYNTQLDAPDASAHRRAELGEQLENGDTAVESSEQTPTSLYRDALTDPDALPAYEQACRASALPADLERDYWQDNDAERFARRCERSVYMADTIIDNETAAMVHLLVGGGHYVGVVDRLKTYANGGLSD